MNREVIVILPKETRVVACDLDEHEISFIIDDCKTAHDPLAHPRNTKEYTECHMWIEGFIHNGRFYFIAKHSDAVGDEEIINAIGSAYRRLVV